MQAGQERRNAAGCCPATSAPAPRFSGPVGLVRTKRQVAGQQLGKGKKRRKVGRDEKARKKKQHETGGRTRTITRGRGVAGARFLCAHDYLLLRRGGYTKSFSGDAGANGACSSTLEKKKKEKPVPFVA